MVTDSEPVGFVLVVHVEKDDAVVIHLVAEAAGMGQLPSLFAALGAPVINQAVIAPADVFLEPAMVVAVHPAIGIGRVVKQAVDDLQDPGVPRRIVLLDLVQLAAEVRRREIGKWGHRIT